MCGCGKEELSFSELTIEHTVLGNEVNGLVKNKTNKDISSVTVALTLKSGDLTQECRVLLIDIGANETKTIDGESLHCDGIELKNQPNFEHYEIIDKKISFINYKK